MINKIGNKILTINDKALIIPEGGVRAPTSLVLSVYENTSGVNFTTLLATTEGIDLAVDNLEWGLISSTPTHLNYDLNNTSTNVDGLYTELYLDNLNLGTTYTIGCTGTTIYGDFVFDEITFTKENQQIPTNLSLTVLNNTRGTNFVSISATTEGIDLTVDNLDWEMNSTDPNGLSYIFTTTGRNPEGLYNGLFIGNLQLGTYTIGCIGTTIYGGNEIAQTTFTILPLLPEISGTYTFSNCCEIEVVVPIIYPPEISGSYTFSNCCELPAPPQPDPNLPSITGTYTFSNCCELPPDPNAPILLPEISGSYTFSNCCIIASLSLNYVINPNTYNSVTLEAITVSVDLSVNNLLWNNMTNYLNASFGTTSKLEGDEFKYLLISNLEVGVYTFRCVATTIYGSIKIAYITFTIESPIPSITGTYTSSNCCELPPPDPINLPSVTGGYTFSNCCELPPVVPPETITLSPSITGGYTFSNCCELPTPIPSINGYYPDGPCCELPIIIIADPVITGGIYPDGACCIENISIPEPVFPKPKIIQGIYPDGACCDLPPDLIVSINGLMNYSDVQITNDVPIELTSTILNSIGSVTASWDITSRPSGSLGADITNPTPLTANISNFVIDGRYECTLTVEDDNMIAQDTIIFYVISDQFTIQIDNLIDYSNVDIASNPNLPLTTSLTNSGTSIKSYLWSVVSTPTFSSSNLTNNVSIPSTATISDFTLIGNYIVRVTVSDNYGRSVEDTITITVVSNLTPFLISQSISSSPCDNLLGGDTRLTRYHNGIGIQPEIGDYIYQTTNKLNNDVLGGGGYYYYLGEADDTITQIRVINTGEVTGKFKCPIKLSIETISDEQVFAISNLESDGIVNIKFTVTDIVLADLDVQVRHIPTGNILNVGDSVSETLSLEQGILEFPYTDYPFTFYSLNFGIGSLVYISMEVTSTTISNGNSNNIITLVKNLDGYISVGGGRGEDDGGLTSL